MNSLDSFPIILAAGGTGGHIFPAEALAEQLLARGERVILMTDKRFAKFQTGTLAQIETRSITAGSSGGNVIRKALGMARLSFGIVQARRMLKALKPKAVIGFGGYPAFPTVYAATRIGLPTLIHEQNSVLGRANKLLAPRVTRIASSFPRLLGLSEREEARLTVTGNPVRGSIAALRGIPYPSLQTEGKIQILITGGSQGASIFSQILPAAMASIPAALRARIRIDQQCREADLEVTRAAYAQLGISADLAPFFTDIPARLASAHLVIARAGASTIAELAAAGRPAILVPYPHAMDNHQAINAGAFEQAGGGWVMLQDAFTATALAHKLETTLIAPILNKAAAAAREFGDADAAIRLADLVISIQKATA